MVHVRSRLLASEFGTESVRLNRVDSFSAAIRPYSQLCGSAALCVRPITPHPGRPTLARLSLRQEVVRLRLHTHHFLRTRTHACARACMTHTRPPASSPPAPVHESGAPGLKSWCLRSRRPGGGSCGATWAPTLGARSTSVPRALRPQAVGPPLRRRSPTWCRHRSSPPCAP